MIVTPVPVVPVPAVIITVETQHSPAQSVGSLPFVLQNLRRKMKSRGLREKLKVDPEDEVMDVYSYYKSSDFDPLIPISVYLKGEPAIDTAGVLHQVFSNVFYDLANNEGIKNIFVGSEDTVEDFLFSATNLLSMAFFKLWVE